MKIEDALRSFRHPTFRRYQKEAIVSVVEAFEEGKRCVFLNAAVGFGKCLRSGHKIFVSDGLQNIENVDSGVMSFDGHDFSSKKIMCSHKFDNQDTVKVTTCCGYSISGTQSHKIMIMNTDGEYEWVKLCDVSKGDVVPILAKETEGKYQDIDYISFFNQRKSKNVGKTLCFRPKVLDENLASLMGIYTAEGHCNGTLVRITNGYDIVVDEIKFVLDSYRLSYSCTWGDKHAYEIGISSKQLSDFLSICGRCAKDKCVPEIVFKSPISVRACFLKMLYSGDGWISKSEIGFASASERLIDDLQILLLSVGILSIKKYKLVNNKGKKFDSWVLRIIAESYNQFYKIVGSFETDSQYCLEELVDRSRNTNIVVVPNISRRLERVWKTYLRYSNIIWRSEKGKYKRKAHTILDQMKNRNYDMTYSSLEQFLECVCSEDYAKKHVIVSEDFKFLDCLLSNRFFFDYIESVENEGEHTVYDISVEETKCYIANGFVSHNSDVNMAVANASNGAAYVVGVKALQDQLTRDFPDVADIRGRSNYACVRNPDKTCDEGMCTNDKKLKCQQPCLYKIAKDNAIESFVYSTNIWYYFLEGGRMFENRDLLIVDEAHGLSEQLADFGKVILSPKTVFGLWDTIKNMKLEDIIPLVEERVRSLENRAWITNEERRRLDKMRNVLTRLDNLRDEYIEDKKSHARIIIPLYSRKQAGVIFSRADKFLFSSATMNKNLMLSELAIRDYFGTDYIFINVPSVFDPLKRPCFCMPIADFKKKNQTPENIEKMRFAVKVILDKHQDERGIIFVQGYRYMEMLKGLSERLLFHDSKSRGRVLNSWLTDDGGNRVLVGVMMEEGLDLKDDLARFSIVLKAPFPDVSDKRVSTRLFRHQWNWYYLLTNQKLCQAYGRIVRSEEDTGSVYILDTKAIDLLKRKGTPKWIKEALIEVDQKRLGEWN